MTGKLIKHDLKSGARRMGNIYLVAFIASVAMIFSALIETGTLMKFLSSAAVVVIAAVAVLVTFASIVFGANKSLFGREGYLTQTLPVRTSSLIFSKWVASSIWLIISYAFCLVAVFAISKALSPLPITVSAMDTQGLLWQKIPAFSLIPAG